MPLLYIEGQNKTRINLSVYAGFGVELDDRVTYTFTIYAPPYRASGLKSARWYAYHPYFCMLSILRAPMST
jgi:hypothetical protein